MEKENRKDIDQNVIINLNVLVKVAIMVGTVTIMVNRVGNSNHLGVDLMVSNIDAVKRSLAGRHVVIISFDWIILVYNMVYNVI